MLGGLQAKVLRMLVDVSIMSVIHMWFYIVVLLNSFSFNKLYKSFSLFRNSYDIEAGQFFMKEMLCYVA